MAKRPAVRTHRPTKSRGDRIKTLEDAIIFILELETKLMAQDARIVAAQNRLSTSLTTLESDVAALKAAQNPDTEANVVDVVNNLKEAADKADAIDATIKPAV